MAHDAETINSHKTQKKLGKQVNRVRQDRYVASLDGLLAHARPPSPFGETYTHECAKARQRTQSGPRAAVWLRARPVDASRVIPAHDFLSIGRRHLGIENQLAATCPACGAVDANTRHARLCHRVGAQVNQHQPLVHVTSRGCPSPTKWKAVRPLTPTGTLYGHLYREERPPRRVGIEVPTRKHTHRRHLRGPPSGGSPACRDC